MIVIYYDGDVQKQFETLVRAVGMSRNSIRKGKMSAKVDSLSRTGSSSSEASSSGGEDGEVGLKLDYKTARPLKRVRGIFRQDDGTAAFDKLDNYLEKAQGLCERAAHQVLRDGDCVLELNKAKEQFGEVRQLAEAELPALQKKADRAAERRRRSEERHWAEMPAMDKGGVDVQVTALAPVLNFDDKLEVDLEADDSDEDDADFSMLSLPLNKYRMRSAPLLVH